MLAGSNFSGIGEMNFMLEISFIQQIFAEELLQTRFALRRSLECGGHVAQFLTSNFLQLSGKEKYNLLGV